MGDLERLEVSTPILEDNLFLIEPSRWELNYRNSEGFAYLEIIYGKLPGSIALTLEKGKSCPVVLQAVYSMEGGKEFRSMPAGFLYPQDILENGSASFSWRNGFMGSLLLDLSEHLDLDHFNISRLSSFLEEKAGNGGDFWTFDYQVLLEEIISGDFSYYDVRLLRQREVLLNLPEGVWMNRSVSGKDILSSGVSENLSLFLPTGINLFLHRSGLVAEVHVMSNGSVEYLVY